MNDFNKSKTVSDTVVEPLIEYMQDGTITLKKNIGDNTVGIRLNDIYQFGDGGLFLRCVRADSQNLDEGQTLTLNLSLYERDEKTGEIKKSDKNLINVRDIREEKVLECLRDRNNFRSDLEGVRGETKIQTTNVLGK